jgi:hypothetical protein
MRIVTQLGHVRKLDFEGICIGSKVFLLSGELLHHIPVATGRQQPMTASYQQAVCGLPDREPKTM